MQLDTRSLECLIGHGWELEPRSTDESRAAVAAVTRPVPCDLCDLIYDPEPEGTRSVDSESHSDWAG